MRKFFSSSGFIKRLFLNMTIPILIIKLLFWFLRRSFNRCQSISKTIIIRFYFWHLMIMPQLHLVSITRKCIVIYKKAVWVKIRSMMIYIDAINVVLSWNLSLIKINGTLRRFSLFFNFCLNLNLLLDYVFI